MRIAVLPSGVSAASSRWPGPIRRLAEVGRPEEVVEERVEMRCDDDRLGDVLAAIRHAHPYEEPAIDVYPLAEIE